MTGNVVRQRSGAEVARPAELSSRRTYRTQERTNSHSTVANKHRRDQWRRGPSRRERRVYFAQELHTNQ